MRQQIDLTGEPVQWAGVGADGQTLPPGLYQFSVESFANGTRIAIDTAQVYSLVTEAKLANGATIVVLAGGAEVMSEAVTALRAPGD